MDLNKQISARTTNLAGGEAYVHDDPREALRMVVINNLLEDTYYEEDTDSLEKVVDRFDRCVRSGHAEFPLQLASYARQDVGVRDIAQVLLVLAANWPFEHNVIAEESSRDYVREYAPDIVARADELCTVIAFNNTLNGRGPGDFSATVPRVLRNALKDIIESGQFDEYQYAKYRKTDYAVSLHDVFNVVHPFEGKGHNDLAERITKGEKDDHDVEPLRQHRTWEDTISEAGQTGTVTAADWRSVLEDMGLFARLRNARSMLEAGIGGEEIFGDVTMDWVRNAKMPPFRYYQVRKALKRAGLMDDYTHRFLEQAVDEAASTVPDELTNTVSVVDVSGSMKRSVSSRSNLNRREIAALFGATLGVRGADVIAFANDVEWFLTDPLNDSVLRLQEDVMGAEVGSSTFAHKAIKSILSAKGRNALPDRVVMFTDYQIWESSRYGNDPNQLKAEWSRYIADHPETPTLYIVDLASYGEIKFPPEYPNVRRLQGWNSRILDYIWHNEQSMLEVIEDV